MGGKDAKGSGKDGGKDKGNNKGKNKDGKGKRQRHGGRGPADEALE